MKKVIWVAGHGPNRSHDMWYAQAFDTLAGARDFVKGRSYWRISRLEYTEPYSPWTKRTDEVGGKDVDEEIERIRQQEEFRTMRKVSQKKALALWRQRMRERHGPGGRMRNPKGKKRAKDLSKLTDRQLAAETRKRIFLAALGGPDWTRHDAALDRLWRECVARDRPEVYEQAYKDVARESMKNPRRRKKPWKRPPPTTRRLHSDFLISSKGSVVLFLPNTKKAKEFAERDLGLESWQWFGPWFVIDANLAHQLMDQLTAEGWTFE